MNMKNSLSLREGELLIDRWKERERERCIDRGRDRERNRKRKKNIKRAVKVRTHLKYQNI